MEQIYEVRIKVDLSIYRSFQLRADSFAGAIQKAQREVSTKEKIIAVRLMGETYPWPF